MVSKGLARPLVAALREYLGDALDRNGLGHHQAANRISPTVGLGGGVRRRVEMSVLETQGVPKLAENVLEALGGDVAEAHENRPMRQTCRQRQGH